ncbi:GIY-YIG nuclease family protein [Sphingomonas bacterium]|uniref:GIY-YIG nuclease family protein n=1 Tax=Sphingomonas bacterium TaxID=1895847 RepID=UPI001576DB06|nr:GIY-YIG nuclease family protein [Sphingomonas bacterium]
MSGAPGRSLELYYVDGKPDGMVTAELFNWTGHVLMAPRTQVGAALKRIESTYAGVYLLIGDDAGEPRAYIGEGEDIAERIRAHDIRKEWWTTMVLVTAAANKLNKAHVRYLEARLIAEARATGRVPLDNGVVPAVPSLSEADIAKMEAFLENLLVVLPAVRVDLFIRRARATVSSPTLAPAATVAGHAPRFVLANRKQGLRATALLTDGEFVVEAGSQARLSWAGLASHTYSGLFAELVRAGVLVVRGEHNVFAESYAFRSPSAAAAMVNGRPSNGQIEWRSEQDDATYRDWEAGQFPRNMAA